MSAAELPVLAESVKKKLDQCTNVKSVWVALS
jgi:hypothetical protein